MFNIGERIYDLRKKLNLTQEEFSEAIDISREHLSRIENNNVTPTIETLFNVCTASGIKMEQFFNPYVETFGDDELIRLVNQLDADQLKLLTKLLNYFINALNKQK